MSDLLTHLHTKDVLVCILLEIWATGRNVLLYVAVHKKLIDNSFLKSEVKENNLFKCCSIYFKKCVSL